mmetsp:Transcript_28499/g.66881  ORF Transcript_28499/g.66881 Transcript_28499/m.66881 type:complete len:322 (+) Transcript_28499:144-1109(+)
MSNPTKSPRSRVSMAKVFSATPATGTRNAHRKLFPAALVLRRASWLDLLELGGGAGTANGAVLSTFSWSLLGSGLGLVCLRRGRWCGQMVLTRGIIKTGTLVDEHLKHLVQSGHQHTRVVERAGGNASIVVELLHRNARDWLIGSQDRRQRCDDMMLRAELQSHWNVAQTIVLLASHQALHHLAHVRCDDAGHQRWGVHKAVRELNFLHLLFQHISDELLHRVLFLLSELSPVLLIILLRLIQVQLEVLVSRVHGDELAVLEALNRIHHELVDVLVQEKNIPLPLHELFHVRGRQCCLPVRAAEVVNVLLSLLRHVHVLLQ